MELSSSDSRGHQGRQTFGERYWKPLTLPLRALPGSGGRCQGKFILGEEVWLLSTAPFKHFFQPGHKEFPRKVSPEDLVVRTPPFPLPVALSLGKVGRGFQLGSSFRKERHSLHFCLWRKAVAQSLCPSPGSGLS